MFLNIWELRTASVKPWVCAVEPLRTLRSCRCLLSSGVFCPQVVYSSSARELKVETVKPDTPEKEEDDIDIDAIWETRMMMLFLCCGFDSRCPVRPKWLALPSFTYPLPSRLCPPQPPTLLCFVAWLNIALYLLHINSVILRCIHVFSWWNEVALGILIMGVWGSFWLHIFLLLFVFFFLVPVFFQSIKNECFAIQHTWLFVFL